MTKEQSSELCTSCGLCCYAFHNIGFVQNEQEEQIIKGFGGTIFTDYTGKLSFKQPCPAFNGVCSVYPNHPISCKKYECELLRPTRNDNIEFVKAKEIIKNTKKEVEIIDSSLESLLGRRTVTVDDYIGLFLKKAEKNKHLKDEYKDLLLHFGVYKYLRINYFDWER